MKKYISLVLIIICLINIFILDIIVFNINNSLNELKAYVYKDKIQFDNNNGISFIGDYEDTTNEYSDKIYISDEKKNNFSIVYGKKSILQTQENQANMYGSYTINEERNQLYVAYYDIDNNGERIDKELKVDLSNDGTYIVINGFKFFKNNK